MRRNLRMQMMDASCANLHSHGAENLPKKSAHHHHHHHHQQQQQHKACLLLASIALHTRACKLVMVTWYLSAAIKKLS
jgi:hypothetical protein